MTIVLNGTTGITNDGGYTGDGVVFADTTPANTLVTDTSGNVMIGTTSASAKLSLNTGAAGNLAYFTDGVNTDFYIKTTSSIATIGPNAGSTNLAFQTSGTERARIDSSGNFIFRGTAQLNGAGTSNYGGFACIRNTATAAGKFWNAPYVDGNNAVYIINQNNTGVVVPDGGTSWAANSDERLKDIIEPITDAAIKVSTLRAVIGKYKTDDEGKRRSFLIAQDVEAVLPEAISRSKLPQSEDDTEYLSVSYTDTIPLLVAAIQEQQAIITALTARVEALESQP